MLRFNGGAKDRKSGQMVILMSTSLFVLFSIMGLSVDLGYSYFVKVDAQTAADSAATAAAVYANDNGYLCGSLVTCNVTYSCPATLTSAGTALQAGCLYAKANGFVNTSPQTVSLIANNTPAPNELGNTPALWIQANVAQSVPHFFLFWAGFQRGSVAAQAISGVTVTPNGSCIYVLDSGSTSGALTVTGGAVLTGSSCGVYVNSSNATAILVSGGTVGVPQIKASQIKVKGGPATCGGGGCSPSPTTGSAVVADPFASLTKPTVPNSCGGSTGTTPYSLTNSATGSIDPTFGVFCGGISVAGSAHLTMAPGTYILNGGGFNISHSGVVTSTGGVTIYLTAQNGQVPAPVVLAGNASVTLSAPTSGTYQGVLFFQDSSEPYATANSVANSATLSATGSLYFPTTKLTLSGAVATGKMAVIAKDFSISGSASFVQDTSGTFTGLAARSPGLIQ